jgi:hypothetical protein
MTAAAGASKHSGDESGEEEEDSDAAEGEIVQMEKQARTTDIHQLFYA